MTDMRASGVIARPGMNLFTIPAHVPFLDAIATDWLRQDDDRLAIARGLILLPTRRAARSLADAFLRASDGQALLLPRIVALGALDEAPLALEGAFDIPPAVEPARRLAELARLILAMGGANGAPRTIDRAWPLAAELAALMDEAERSGIDLAASLPKAADPRFAAHWAQTLQFLDIVTRAWPQWLRDQGLMNPAARQVALLDAQAAAWQARPPTERVLLAGTTGGIPAVARLARVVAGLPGGAVLLPGLDMDLEEQAWEALPDSHPQAGLRRLLTGLGATRGDVRPLATGGGVSIPSGRATTIRRALLPGGALRDWTSGVPADTDGLWRLSPADQQEEAAAIALVLRGALETPGARAALVTPDRDLAGRTVAELERYGVVADDSAGEKLADTPPAVFLRLLAVAMAERLAPVPLLAVLKHPLAGVGLAQADCRTAARALEMSCLRGQRPGPGLAGLRRRVDDRHDAHARAFLARIESCFVPALRMDSAAAATPVEMLTALIATAERLAATDAQDGPSRLWAGEEGDALATALAAAREALEVIGDQPHGVLPGLLDAVLEGAVVRTRRALRGGAANEHPRIFIWGLLEARLQAADVLVLGGLSEGTWPPRVEPGPWLSRPMRNEIGLPSPEEVVGQSAHDFAQAACAAPTVVLSCPRRRDGAPAVPARWLTRLEKFLRGQNRSLPEHPAAAWAGRLDQPAVGPRPVTPPQPRPAVELRPSRLSVTEIETWLRDPYAIYARHVLRLKKLDGLDEETDAADYGQIVHDGLHRFLRAHGTRWPADAAERLRDALLGALGRTAPRAALQAWWEPRLARIADWVARTESERRAKAPPSAIVSEAQGSWVMRRPGRAFELVGRADRIERRDGGISILDYKTGTPPSQKEVADGLASQLLLEAAMAVDGAFGPEMAAAAVELVYWHLSGGFKPGASVSLFQTDSASIAAAVRDATDALARLIDEFDDPARAYLSHPHPTRAPRFADYAQLARVAEWMAAGEEE
jgi:ATP-dependent helicase/nuclease subunit B